MALVVLLLAWANFWLSTVATTCTMCDTGSVKLSVVTSTPLYLLGVALLLRGRRGPASALLGLLLVPALAWQAWIALRMVWAVNIHGGCACWAYQTYPMEAYLPPSGLDLLLGPVHLAAALGSTAALLAAWSRRRPSLSSS